MLKKTINIAVMAMLCLNFWAKGQIPTETVQPFIIGEMVPKNFWTTEYTIYKDGKAVKQNLSQYQGKILLLDFWASWCTNCIKSFPKLSGLKNKYGLEMNMLLVNSAGNGDDLERISQVYQRINSGGLSFTIESIIQDTALRKMFPHKMLPFYVWIDASGRVNAYSGSAFLNKENFESLIEKAAKKTAKTPKIQSP